MTGLVLYNSFWFDRPAAVYLILASKTSSPEEAAEMLAKFISAKRFTITDRPIEDAEYFNVPLRKALVLGDQITIW